MNQLKALKEIYRTANISPVFRPNAKYASQIKENEVPYIALNDVLEDLFVIRLLPCDVVSRQFPITAEGQVLVEYQSIEELVKDGWELD